MSDFKHAFEVNLAVFGRRAGHTSINYKDASLLERRWAKASAQYPNTTRSAAMYMVAGNEASKVLGLNKDETFLFAHLVARSYSSLVDGRMDERSFKAMGYLATSFTKSDKDLVVLALAFINNQLNSRKREKHSIGNVVMRAAKNPVDFE